MFTGLESVFYLYGGGGGICAGVSTLRYGNNGAASRALFGDD